MKMLVINCVKTFQNRTDNTSKLYNNDKDFNKKKAKKNREKEK